MNTEIYNLISAITQIVTLAVLIWAVHTAMRQFKAARQNTWAQAFQNCVAMIQEPSVVSARGIVFAMNDRRATLSDASKEEIAAIDLICRTYDVVGMIAQWGMIPKEIIVDSWCDSIRRLWPICEPRVKQRRTNQKADEFWDDFEWLYQQAKEFDQNRTNELKRVRTLQGVA
jgi:hypothetical protein